jgi:hypothetical protein
VFVRSAVRGPPGGRTLNPAPPPLWSSQCCSRCRTRCAGLGANICPRCCCAPAAAAADVVLGKAGVLGGAPLAADSPLLSAPTLAKLSPADAAPAAQLAQCLLQQHSQHLKQGEYC